MKKSNNNFHNYYTLTNTVSNLLPIIAVLTCSFVAFFLIYFEVSNWVFLYIYLFQLILSISIYWKYSLVKPINKKDIKSKYVYHCLSKDKLNAVMDGNIVHLKKTTKKYHNKSTLFKNVVYYHSSLRTNSFFYNHSFRYKKLDYVLIIPVSNLSNNLSVRKRDGAIVDFNDYKGKAKCIPISKLNIYKPIEKKYRTLIVRGYLQSFLMYTTIYSPLIWWLALLFDYIGII